MFRLPGAPAAFILFRVVTQYSRPGWSVRLRGHEVVSHTSPEAGGGYCCRVFLLDPFASDHELKVFRAIGEAPVVAECSALADVLRFLELPGPITESDAGDHGTVSISGRIVDIFCDVVGEGLHQAFPFLRRADGTRVLIMQFHLVEAVTAESAASAMAECINRLERYFSEQPSAPAA